MKECSQAEIDDDASEYGPRLDPNKLEEVRKRAEQAKLLFEELMQAGALPLAEPRFRNPDLLELVLEEARNRQVEEPAIAQKLAALARHLIKMLTGEAEVRTASVRAMCLEANARRLQRDLDGAANTLAIVAPILEFATERALYCQTMALIRWEQGRMDEAEALLARALYLYTLEESEYELADCQALLGLLREEERSLGDPTFSLVAAWATLRPNSPPYLLVRVALALAVVYAEQNQIVLARRNLNDAQELFVHLKRQKDRLYAHWAEARALALLGDREEARHLLEFVGQGLWEVGDTAGSLVSAVDLLVLLAEVGDHEAIREALADLAEAPHGVNTSLISNLGEHFHNGLPPDPRKLGHVVSSALRRIFRAARAASTPFPFGVNA
jgi:tetratricopeptide (TPR) repeat protein